MKQDEQELVRYTLEHVKPINKELGGKTKIADNVINFLNSTRLVDLD